jgi:TrkA domain protein
VTDIEETPLPGVGVRHDFVTSSGVRVGVLVHRSGRRELLVYDRADPDSCVAVVRLDTDDAHALVELLGGSQVSEHIAAVQRIEGLTIDWLPVAAGSALADRTIGESALRVRTGASLVAVVRSGETIAAPGPEFTIRPGDTIVAVGSPESIEQLVELLRT